MKKLLISVLLTALTVSLLSGCGSSQSKDAVEKYGSATLKLYNWGEYMGENLISGFEEEFGVNVIIEYYDSNEMMYTKLQSGESYDVLVPSDYMIERLISDDSLLELDKTKIPNMSNLDAAVLDLAFDPDNTYSVPYFWGNVGIVYNKNNVDLADLESEGFAIMKDTKYAGKIYMYDSERDSFMIALKSLGYSCNTEDEQQINAAYEWLVELNTTMDPVYVTDEVLDYMIGGGKDLAIVYSGDASYILDENEDMGFYVPDEGTNIWCDSMVIPKNAENPLLAYEFINYVLSYDASLDNTETVGYASPNAQVLADVTAEDGIYADNEAYLPRMNYALDEVFKDNLTLKQKLAELWIKVKASN